MEIKLPTLRARIKFIANASALTHGIAEIYMGSEEKWNNIGNSIKKIRNRKNTDYFFRSFTYFPFLSSINS